MFKKKKGAIMKRDQRMVEFTEHINKFMQQTVHAFSLVDKQLSELNSVLFALLKDMGKLEDADCESCGKNITSPVINGLSKKKECPTCCESPVNTSNQQLKIGIEDRPRITKMSEGKRTIGIISESYTNNLILSMSLVMVGTAHALEDHISTVFLGRISNQV